MHHVHRPAVQVVRCVQGCGGGNSDVWVIVGLVVAGLSLCVAFSAWRVSQKSLGIARTEHRVFLERFNARADFDLSLTVAGRVINDNVIEVSDGASQMGVLWQAGITNSGTKSADGAVINFLFPRWVADLSWVSQGGVVIPDPHRTSGPITTSEELMGSDGQGTPAKYLAKEIARVRRKGSRVTFARAVVPTPDKVGGEVRVPVSFRIGSDDLPDDVEDRREDLEIVLRRTR